MSLIGGAAEGARADPTCCARAPGLSVHAFWRRLSHGPVREVGEVGGVCRGGGCHFT